MGEKGLSLPATPKGWAIRLTQILSAVQGTHGLPRFPIDVAALAQPVLKHRMALGFAARAEGVRLDEIIDACIKAACP